MALTNYAGHLSGFVGFSEPFLLYFQALYGVFRTVSFAVTHSTSPAHTSVVGGGGSESEAVRSDTTDIIRNAFISSQAADDDDHSVQTIYVDLPTQSSTSQPDMAAIIDTTDQQGTIR